MPIRIVDHHLDRLGDVREFNGRMRDKGSTWAFYEHPEPVWLSKRGEQSVWRQYYLAEDDHGIVRGGYCLKRQDFWFENQVQSIASFQGPISEGSVDPRYASVAITILRDMLSKEANLFAWGPNHKLTGLLEAAGWWITDSPLCLKVVRPYRFLRHNGMLRHSAGKRIVLDCMALTGMGWIGFKALSAFGQWNRRLPLDADFDFVPEFGPWQDDLWQRCRKHYRVASVRNQEALNVLLRPGEWPPVERIRVTRDSQVVGVAAILNTSMSNDPRFGSLRVGTIVDNFAVPSDSGRVIAAATAALCERGVDLIISNQTHPHWVRGFAANGYQILPNKRVFALSKSLHRTWQLDQRGMQDVHFTTLDGEGPVGLAPAGMPRSKSFG